MYNVAEVLNARIECIKRAIKLAEKEEGRFPEGRLRTSKSSGRVRYYEVHEKNDTNGEYLHKTKQLHLIKSLAQKDYNEKFLIKAREEQKLLEKLLLKYRKSYCESVYENLSEGRQNLIRPYILSDDQFAHEWQSRTFKTNPYRIENKIYDTRKGEKVRSKSEAIIADMLFEMGIPYHYEYPLRLKDGNVRFPDFTILKVSTREEIYLEHFGLLDDEEYRKENMYKLDIYRANGIYIGKNLIFTYETADNPLDINGIRRMLKDILL